MSASEEARAAHRGPRAFDVQAFFDALDERPRHEQLSSARLTADMWGAVRGPERPA